MKIIKLDKFSVIYDENVLSYHTFNEELFNEYIDEKTDLYIPLLEKDNTGLFFNKTVLFYEFNEPRNLYDLLPLFIINNNYELKDFDNELNFYKLNKYIIDNNLKIKFIPKIIFNIDIDWDKQLDERKKELKELQKK